MVVRFKFKSATYSKKLVPNKDYEVFKEKIIRGKLNYLIIDETQKMVYYKADLFRPTIEKLDI